MARGIAVDLLQMAKRIGPQCEATEHKDLSREKSLTLDCIAIVLSTVVCGICFAEPDVGVKIGGSRVGGPELCV